MLSRVIAARDVEGVLVATFPFARIEPLVSGSRHAAFDGEPGTELALDGAGPGGVMADRRVNAALRETIHRLEEKHAAEQRQALEAGRQQGEQQARAELQPVLERLNASINEVISMRPDLRRRAEKDVVQLALLIAKRVLHRELSVDENALTAIARVAFERLTRSESYSVTVHPRFAAGIKAALPASHAGRVRIEPDPDCAAGTLVIRSPEGVIDASIDAQLEEISRGLTDRLASS
jgi:flagellar assembly protein FliH